SMHDEQEHTAGTQGYAAPSARSGANPRDRDVPPLPGGVTSRSGWALAPELLSVTGKCTPRRWLWPPRLLRQGPETTCGSSAGHETRRRRRRRAPAAPGGVEPVGGCWPAGWRCLLLWRRGC